MATVNHRSILNLNDSAQCPVDGSRDTIYAPDVSRSFGTNANKLHSSLCFALLTPKNGCDVTDHYVYLEIKMMSLSSLIALCRYMLKC